MAAGAKILSGLTDNAVRWVESLSRKLGDTYGSGVSTDPETIAGQMGEKLVNVSREVPESFNLYEAERLYQTIVDANEGFLDLAAINPKTFGEAAYDVPLHSNFLGREDPIRRQKYEEKMQDVRDRINSGLLLDDYPELANRNYLDIAEIVGHDGRHRNRILEELGIPQSLVKIVPEETMLHNYAAPDQLLSKMDPSTKLIGQEGNEVGTLGQLIKFLSIAPPVAGSMASSYESLADQGRGGDTELAHINSKEAKLLELLGGSNTINPNTGLREFYDSSGPDAMGAGGRGEMAGPSGNGGGVGNPGLNVDDDMAGMNLGYNPDDDFAGMSQTGISAGDEEESEYTWTNALASLLETLYNYNPITGLFSSINIDDKELIGPDKPPGISFGTPFKGFLPEINFNKSGVNVSLGAMIDQLAGKEDLGQTVSDSMADLEQKGRSLFGALSYDNVAKGEVETQPEEIASRTTSPETRSTAITSTTNPPPDFFSAGKGVFRIPNERFGALYQLPGEAGVK